MTRILRSLAAAALVAATAMVASPSEAQILPQAATCGGVWVVVDYGSLGGTSTKCASSYGTGLKALKSAGFSVTIDDSFVYKINGKPSKPDINKAYWSYWHATKKDDGSYSAWSYSNTGADSSEPVKGNAEGWRYQSLSDGEVPPAIAPPAADTSTPTAKPTKSASHKPSATATATKSASKSPSASRTASPTASATPTSASPTPTSATPTPTESTIASTEPSELGTIEFTATPEPTDGAGSPVGAMVAGGAVVVAAAGLGGWWLLKGRKR